jgi:hypothetical protein
MLDHYLVEMTSLESKLVLNTLVKIFAIPNAFLAESSEEYLKALKEHISFGNANLYIEILDSIA